MLVLLLGLLVILSVAGGGNTVGGLAWHAGLTALCVCFAYAGQGAMPCVLAVVMAVLTGLLAVQMSRVPATARERGGIRLAGGLLCVALLAQVIVHDGSADITARLAGLAGLAAIMCGAWGACLARAPVALCASLAYGLDGVTLLAAQADSMLGMGQAVAAAVGLNIIMAAVLRGGSGGI
ncbi:hypothetical protein DY926_07065 [Komagataeibacter melaceti]|uniref:Uncharacterized protein n=1 Tax=Komagataeibacter melaceti TaxID=2766577 RepID=A0A371Z193_9PROT|nr:hypothetical protein [Komagataeibacter melaceti]RFD20248.1 hypothetical protein DY926_07065 [Komagataeibacter melaceti]